MKYVYVFSLLFFIQLSWGSGGTQPTQDHVDTVVEIVCKDHEDLETCIAEEKVVILHETLKRIGGWNRHNFLADSSDVIRPTIMEYSPNTDNPLELGIDDEIAIKTLYENTQPTQDHVDIAIENVCKDHEDPETCKAEVKVVILHETLKRIGERHSHNFLADSSDVIRPTIMEYSPNTNNPLELGVYDEIAKTLYENHENPEACVNIAVESVCKDRENPEACKAEVKTLLLYGMVRQGLRHNFFADPSDIIRLFPPREYSFTFRE